MLGLNKSMLDQWWEINGDNTKLINYDLTSESKILDLGGYNGTWIRKMIEKYDPYVYVIEPIKEFHDDINSQFSHNSKFKILNVGISDSSHTGVIYLDRDSTSMHAKNSDPREVKFQTMEEILESFEIKYIDLLQINIEGEEYRLLEKLISNGLVNRFKNIQVQFHTGIEDYEARREKIKDGLVKNGFLLSFEFPFIWEGWAKS